MSGKMSRRTFLRVSSLVAVSSIAAACVPAPAPGVSLVEPASEPHVAPAAPKASEAPMLAQMVQDGTLPPLDERLPEDVMVVGPGVLIPESVLDFQVGEYGGTLRHITPRPSGCADLYDAMAEPPLIAPGRLTASSLADITPNVLREFVLSDDLKSVTFHMRRGLKWSDGHPCTTADVAFWYEDVLLNEQITPIPSKIYRSGNRADGTLMRLEVVDDYTFRFVFDEPARAIIAWMSGYANNWHSIMRPAHYMKQFHIKYADPQELKALLAEANLPEAEWWRYYIQRDEGTVTWTNLANVDPNYPTLNPWLLETQGPTAKTYVRNPYYWKVDIAGNQLPYIDRLNVEIVSSIDALVMKILAGEVDWNRAFASTQNLPLYMENAEKGGFGVQIYDAHVAPLQFAFNFTHPDPVWREVIRDVRFRKALNMAINHERVVELAYQGFGGPPDLLGVEYDPEGASRLLDEMGMDQRDEEGWRLGPDGKTFVFPLDVEQDKDASQNTVCELLVEYWQDVGIKTDWRLTERTLYNTRHSANELYIRMGWAHTGFWRAAPTGSDFRPDASRLWEMWNTSGGTEGEEPDLPWAKRLYEIANIADSYVLTGTETQELHDELWTIMREEVPTIIPADYSIYPLHVSLRLGNTPTGGQAIVAAFTQEQFYLKS